jgi:hypothetical protein
MPATRQQELALMSTVPAPDSWYRSTLMTFVNRESVVSKIAASLETREPLEALANTPSAAPLRQKLVVVMVRSPVELTVGTIAAPRKWEASATVVVRAVPASRAPVRRPAFTAILVIRTPLLSANSSGPPEAARPVFNQGEKQSLGQAKAIF